MSPDTLTRAASALLYPPPSPDEAGNPFYNIGYAAVPGADEIVVLSLSKAAPSAEGGFELIATAYGLGPQPSVPFQKVLADVNNASFPGGVYAPSLTVLGDGAVAAAWQVVVTDHAGNAQDFYAVLSGAGQILGGGPVAKEFYGSNFLNHQGPADLYSTATGFNLEWNSHSAFLASNPFNPQQFAYAVQSFDAAGTPGVRYTTGLANGETVAFAAHAFAAAPPVSLQLADNLIQVYDGANLAGSATIPGEPAHAITREAAALLADGHAAVAWVDSGTAYVSVFSPFTDTFAATAGLSWGGVQDVHLVALPDGGFVVSWTNTLPPFGSPMSMPPRYQGEVFTADGAHGPVMTLDGDVAGIDSHGDLYTVSSFPNSEYIVTYAINSGSSGGGQTFTSDNAGDHWIGTPGNDTFNLGRGGDVVTGNGGDDIYRFAEVPWAGGHITDFNAGDVLDLTGLVSTTADTGPDGFADGYLRITEGPGGAEVWASYHQPGNEGWWLVETLDGVAPASLQHLDDVITVGGSGGGGPTSVTTPASNYVAPSTITAITLSGVRQTIDASATNGVTITSNNSGNTLIGGAGDDLFHLGRGGDVATGAAGADTFAFAEVPWAGATITDFSASQADRIDVSGLLASAGFTGPDPFAAGYLKYGADAGGDAQVWADYNQPGNAGWWLVATLDGVSTSSLHYSGGLIT